MTARVEHGDGWSLTLGDWRDHELPIVDMVCEDPPYGARCHAGQAAGGKLAAIRLGRRFHGYERKPEHFEIALKRLRAAREQFQLFPEETR